METKEKTFCAEEFPDQESDETWDEIDEEDLTD